MPSREKGALGYDVDDNAVRFSNYFHVLRELVHLSCGWLPLEASFQPAKATTATGSCSSGRRSIVTYSMADSVADGRGDRRCVATAMAVFPRRHGRG